MMSPLFTLELKSALILTTLPDTTDPTGTVLTGLIVPVACTTCETSPFSTLAVKNCALDRVPTEIYPAHSSSATGGATNIARCSIDRCQYSFNFPMKRPIFQVPSRKSLVPSSTVSCKLVAILVCGPGLYSLRGNPASLSERLASLG